MAVSSTRAAARKKKTKGRKKTNATNKLQRRNFSRGTLQAIVLKPGQHRRHIISNHLMKNALQTWWNAHEHDPNVTMKFDDLEATFDALNNYLPNLIPGPGAANSAIGMISNQLERSQESLESETDPATIADRLKDERSGFQRELQNELLEPTYDVVKSMQSSKDAIELIRDIHLSTDFDWPGSKNPNHFAQWYDAWESFRKMTLANEAEKMDQAEFDGIVNAFLSLPKPDVPIELTRTNTKKVRMTRKYARRKKNR